MSISRSVINSFLAQIPVQILGIISGIIIARMIGPSGKGVFAIYQANAQFIVLIFSLSFNNVLSYIIPSKKTKPEVALGISIYIIILASIAILIIVFLLFNYGNIGSFFPNHYFNSFYLFWFFLFSILSLVNTLINGIFQGLKLFNEINRVFIINSILNLLCFGLLYIYKLLCINCVIDVVFILYILLFVTLLNSIHLIRLFYKKVKIKPVLGFAIIENVKEIRRYTLYTYFSMLFAFLNIRFNYWLLNAYLDEKSIGLYSLAINLVTLFNMLSAPFGNILMPYLSGYNNDVKVVNFYKYSKIHFTLLSVGSLAAFFASELIIPLVYGDEFGGSVILFKILIPGIILSGQTRMYAVYLASSNRQDYNFYSTLLGGLLNLYFSYTMVRNYGLIGTSISAVLTYLIVFLGMSYFVHVKLKLRMGNYFFIEKKDFKQWRLKSKSSEV